jgi:hypothetical protein
VIPSRERGREGWVEVPPPIGGGRLLRTYRRLLAISALISVSVYFRLLPPLLSICSSIASATVLLCAALVLAAMCTALLDLMCLPILSCNTSFGSSSSGCCFLLLVPGGLIRLEFFFFCWAGCEAIPVAASPSPASDSAVASIHSARFMSGSSSILRNLRFVVGSATGTVAA